MNHNCDVKFHVEQLLEIYRKHEPHVQNATTIIIHLRELAQIKELKEYFENTHFPYYPSVDHAHELSLNHALHSHDPKIKKQFLDFIHNEMQSDLRKKLQTLR